MFSHLSGLFQQLLRIAHHLRVPHSMTWLVSLSIGNPTAFSSSPFSMSAGTRPVSEPGTLSRLTTVWNAQLAFITLLQFQH
ncbi:Uncharacterised protein [Salmonella enterica subsp. enterica]|uniref:Uncharacterized protein n=1 Tax=Salmonella enterica I TaxID=59201 RepID=A0A379WI71_SALET|nr:Uncharacterised protein [Salmonella enterica subsp. enterica]